jgi:hypothetical protein
MGFYDDKNLDCGLLDYEAMQVVANVSGELTAPFLLY